MSNSIKSGPRDLEFRAVQQQEQDENLQQSALLRRAVTPKTIQAVQSTEAPIAVDPAAVATGTASISGPSALAAPTPPPVQLGETEISGALTFGENLQFVGDLTDDSDLLLARFLKIQVLSETEDKWGQSLARQAQSMLMVASIEASKNATLNEANELWAQADSLANQAEQHAAGFKLDASTALGGLLDGLGSTAAPALSYNNGELTTSPTAPAGISNAVDAFAAADKAAQAGNDAEAARLDAQAKGSLTSLQSSGAQANFAGGRDGGAMQGSSSGIVAKIEGDLYDIGAMPSSTLTTIVGMLVQADELNQRANFLAATHAQGQGARNQRMGQQLLNSEARNAGNDQFLDAVMKTMSGTAAADAKLEALSRIEAERASVAALVLQGADQSNNLSRALNQPILG